VSGAAKRRPVFEQMLADSARASLTPSLSGPWTASRAVEGEVG